MPGTSPPAKTLSVVVASHNPAKLDAARRAFAESFPGAAIDIVPTEAESGVAEQPVGDGETRRGALNRAHDARRREPRADYWVGMEGGIETVDGATLAFAWMAVIGPGDRPGLARSATLPLPPAVCARLERGEELGTANDAEFGTVGSKQRGGAFALLSGGRFTREGVYAQALCLALLPFVNPRYAESPGTRSPNPR